MGTFDALLELPLRVDACSLEALSLETGGGLRRTTTVVRLEGGGAAGHGEDVTWERDDQERFRADGPPAGLAGRSTLDGFSRRLDELELFPGDAPTYPRAETSRDFRRWAFESAALDLALRQAGRSLSDALGIAPRPVRFVASLGLGRPPTLAPLRALRARVPDLGFKLDWSDAWTPELLAGLAELGGVAVVDFKGHYRGTPVDQEPDAAGYTAVARALPDAWLEDPLWTAETAAALAGARDRVAWDAPIHSVADLDALPFPPPALNVKPSRFGTLRRLGEALDRCADRGIATYCGGQFELGPGRHQVQALAALYCPDAPSDVAPREYHAPERAARLPASPLAVDGDAPGFGVG